MMVKSNHSFHLVDQSPWPLTAALGAMALTSGMVKWFHQFTPTLMLLGTAVLLLTTYQWWRDVAREGAFQGLHPLAVASGLRWGMVLFITSEALFFFSFSWAFFHSSLSPTSEIGLLWTPTGITPFNAFQVPLLNTIILLSSGVSVTWAHHALMLNNFTQTTQALSLTIALGVYFTSLQALEYREASFAISDSVYGSAFFVATGFHSLHVLIGTSFLFVCLLRHLNCQFSCSHHFGFEAAAWYWHFVDVVWLFLYVSIYWWGS